MVRPSQIAGPASMAQVGTLAGEFERLGYTRPARLAAAADILGIDSLGSFGELSQDQAGNLFAWIRHPEHPPALRADVTPASLRPADGREPSQCDARTPQTVTEAEEAIALVLAAAVLLVARVLDDELRRRLPPVSSQAA